MEINNLFYRQLLIFLSAVILIGCAKSQGEKRYQIYNSYVFSPLTDANIKIFKRDDFDNPSERILEGKIVYSYNLNSIFRYSTSQFIIQDVVIKDYRNSYKLLRVEDFAPLSWFDEVVAIVVIEQGPTTMRVDSFPIFRDRLKQERKRRGALSDWYDNLMSLAVPADSI